jgi:hypothetical protein
MKRFLMLIALLAAFGGSEAGAQEGIKPIAKPTPKSSDYKWTVDLGAGLSLYHELFLGDFLARPDLVPGGTTRERHYTLPYVLSADIYRQVGPNFKLGLRTTLGYKQHYCYDRNDKVLGQINLLPATVVLVGKVSYYKGSEFEFYGTYGLGVSVDITIRDFYWKPSPSVAFSDLIAEVYPLGMRWGRKQGFLCEFGMGSKGLFNMGYFCNF